MSPPPPPVRVIVIDDNDAIHQDFRKILCAANRPAAELEAAEVALFGDSPSTPGEACVLEHARDGAAGIEAARRAQESGEPFDVAFLDMWMPGGATGVEVARTLCELCPQMAIVFCSANGAIDRRDFASFGPARYRMSFLAKPFERLDVLNIVQRARR